MPDINKVAEIIASEIYNIMSTLQARCWVCEKEIMKGICGECQETRMSRMVNFKKENNNANVVQINPIR